MSVTDKLRAIATLFGEDSLSATADNPFSKDPGSSKDAGELSAVPGAPEAGDDAGGAMSAVPGDVSAVPGEQEDPLAPEAPGGLGQAPMATPPEEVSDKPVYVCPFDGSGKIVGQSDGTIKCEHCATVFNVEVRQPTPAMPTVDKDGKPINITQFEGQDYPTPGQAQAPGAEAPVDEGVSEDLSNDAPAVPGGDTEEGEDDDKDMPDFLKGGSLYVTASGLALNEEAYVTHLAEDLL